MHVFQRNAPIDFTPYPPPSGDRQAGLPLTQGMMFTMISMVIGDRCTPDVLDAISHVDPNAWYLGQTLEAILDAAAETDPRAPYDIGQAVYFMMPDQMRLFGITSPLSFFQALPALWKQVTVGPSGEMRVRSLTSTSAVVELELPYNCQFEQGAIVGFLLGLGHQVLVQDHHTCRRNGAPHCTLHMQWSANPE